MTPLIYEQAAKLRTARTELLQALNELKGVEAFDSAANFILFRTANASEVKGVSTLYNYF